MTPSLTPAPRAAPGREDPARKVTRFVQKHFLLLLLLAYALAAVLPAAGCWAVKCSPFSLPLLGERGRVTLPMLLLSALLFCAGLEVSLSRLAGLLRRPGPLVAGLLTNAIVPVALLAALSPLLTGKGSEGGEALLLGLALVAAMPIAGSATAWAQRADGDIGLSLGLVVASTVTSLATTPLRLLAIGLFAPAAVAAQLRGLAGGDVGVFLLACVLAPSALGMIARRLIGDDRAAALRPRVKLICSAVLLALVYANASASLPRALAHPDPRLLGAIAAAALTFCAASFASGWLLARLLGASRAEEASLVFSLGMSNNGSGLVLATVAFAAQPLVGLVIVFYNLVQHLVAAGVERMRMPEATRPAWVGVALRPVAAAALLVALLPTWEARA